MRTLERLAVAVALITVLVALVSLAMSGGTYRGRATAISPTPAPWQVDWSIDLPERPVAGSALSVSAEAILTQGPAPSSPANEPAYRLAVMGTDPPLELRSDATVLPTDVADGAEWELFARAEGEATIEISLTYRQTWCYPCDTRFITESTTRAVTVKLLPGDVDCNLEADSIDVALLLQLVASLIDELACQDAADVNTDGSADTLDAALILQYSAGLLDSLSVAG